MSSSAKQLKWIEEHLPYEFQMFEHTAGKLAMPLPRLDWNAFYESFGVHARVLYDFLTNRAGPNNFKAKDFIAGFKSEKNNLTKDFIQRVGPQIFHPGKNRPHREVEKLSGHDCRAFAQWISDEMNRFVANLKEPYRSKWNCSQANLPNPSDIITLSPGRPTATNRFTTTTVIVNK